MAAVGVTNELSPEAETDLFHISRRDTRKNIYGEPVMQTAKQDALNAIGQLPDTADMGEIMYRLYVLDKVRRGQEDVEQGRVTDAKALGREIEQW